MENFDLNIDNYTIDDLENFFKFQKNVQLTVSDIEMREFKIREQLLNSGHVNKKMKRDLIDFLTSAKQRLIDARCPSIKPHSSIPKNYELDKDQYPALKPEFAREGDLIQKPPTQYIVSHQSEYVPDYMNPLKKRVIQKCLTIDTRFRDNYYGTTSTDFAFQLPIKISKVVSMQLSSFEIPVSFYGISSSYGNHFLWVTITHLNPQYNINKDLPENQFKTVSKAIQISDGNYNGPDLITSLNNAFCPRAIDDSIANPNDHFSYIQFELDITESGSGTGKVTCKATGAKANEIKDFSLDFRCDMYGTPDQKNISTKLGWNLGFTRDYYSGKKCYVSDTIIEPASIRYIYLAIDDYNNNVNNHFITAFNHSVFSPNIIARISIKGNYFSLLMENDLNLISEPREYFGPVDIQKLKIQMYDDHGRILNMNGANYSFCLLFKTMYDM